MVHHSTPFAVPRIARSLHWDLVAVGNEPVKHRSGYDRERNPASEPRPTTRSLGESRLKTAASGWWGSGRTSCRRIRQSAHRARPCLHQMQPRPFPSSSSVSLTLFYHRCQQHVSFDTVCTTVVPCPASSLACPARPKSRRPALAGFMRSSTMAFASWPGGMISSCAL